MANSIRDFVSSLNTDLKALNIDMWVSPSYLYTKAVDIISDFLKKDNSSNLMIYSQEEGWSVLPKIEMEEIPLASCGLDVYICNKVMKSKKRLPAIYTSKVAPIIKEIASVDYTNTYSYKKTFNQWKATQKAEFISKRYYLIIDGYLYIPVGKKDGVESPQITTATIYAVSKKEVDEFNGVTTCKKMADYELVAPSYLINDVKKEILNQMRSMYAQTQTDNLPNQNDAEKTNQKTVG